MQRWWQFGNRKYQKSIYIARHHSFDVVCTQRIHTTMEPIWCRVFYTDFWCNFGWFCHHFNFNTISNRLLSLNIVRTNCYNKNEQFGSVLFKWFQLLFHYDQVLLGKVCSSRVHMFIQQFVWIFIIFSSLPFFFSFWNLRKRRKNLMHIDALRWTTLPLLWQYIVWSVCTMYVLFE